MKRLRSAFEQYLSEIGRLKPVQLGPKEKRQITQEHSDFLMKFLDRQLSFNKNLVILYVVLLIIVFAISVFLVFYFLNSPKIIGMVFGGSCLGILAILDRLRRRWREKSVMDLAFIVVRELPPKETVKVIETLYWNSIRK